jgi:uncharacterized protein
MLNKLILFAAVIMMPISAFAANYSIKAMTPEVKQALDSRKERFSELRDLKSEGAIGENNRGYVHALNEKAKTLVAAENKDRKVIYQTIAEQNNLEDALSTIESAFAQVQRDKAEAGDKIQDDEGNWINK